MRPTAIVEIQIAPERSTRLTDAVIGSQINFFVFDRPPQPLDEHVIAPGTAAIHADRDGVLQQQASECGAGELTALVGVENLWPTVSGERLLDRLKAELDLPVSYTHLRAHETDS